MSIELLTTNIQRPRAMRDAFLTRLYERMRVDERIFFVTADFGSPVLDKIRADFPERFVNVGIAEQNLINVSAGLALEGYCVFAYAIAPFITMRCYEQVRVNLALLSTVRSMNVNLIGVGAGYSYVVSGPTHQCYEDLSIMRAMPNMAVFSPSDEAVAMGLFDVCVASNGPKYLRLDAQVLPRLARSRELDFGLGFHLYDYRGRIAIIATGYMVHTALHIANQLVCENVSVDVVEIFDITGFDGNCCASAIGHYDGLMSLEEGFRGRGGLDSMLFDFLGQRAIRTPFLNVGIEGGYRFDLGTREQLHERAGVGKAAVLRRVKAFIQTLGFNELN